MPHTVWQNPVTDSFRRAMPAWLGAQPDARRGPARRQTGCPGSYGRMVIELTIRSFGR